LATARSIAISLVALAASLLPCATAGAATLPAGFEEIDLVTGLSRPMKVAWTPDGRRLIAEKDGVLKVAAPGSSSATTVLDFRGDVNHSADRGFLGVAVDSSYSSNNYVYLLYSHELQPLIGDQESAPADAKLDRIKLSPGNQVSDRTTILGTESRPGGCPTDNDIDCIPSDDTSHSIGTVISAPDGTLFVGAGDGAKYSAVDERALRSLDESGLAGKILHVDRNGRGLPGHAFCPAESDLTRNCTKIHAKGFRNPFRFTLRSDGALTVGDVGWGSWEEINLIPAAGRDYGWPCYEGRFPNSAYSGFAPCQQYANGARPAPSPPAIVFEHAPGTDNAIMAGPTYAGSAYPAAYQDKLFTGDYGRGLLRTIAFNGAGEGASTGFGSGWLGVDLSSAPGSGNVVYAYPGPTFGNDEGTIREIRYPGGNLRPIADATATPTFGEPPLAVSFDGRTTRDPDGDPLSYSWSFGDGTTGTGSIASHTYSARGVYNVTLTVDDGRGGIDSIERPIRIDVGNDPPVPTIQAPATYRGGESVMVTGSATDPEDDQVPESRLSWRILLVHGSHNHPRSVPNGARISFVADPQHDADSHYELTLTATDSAGRPAQTGARIDPQTTLVRLRSEPGGVPVSYGESTYATPRDLVSAIGFQTSVVVPPELSLGGGIFGFQDWSDGGARLHAITVPAAGLTLTARYGQLVAGPGGIGSGGPPKPPADGKAPTLKLSGGRARDLARGLLRGQVSDPAGVKSVRLALAKLTASGCRWWSAKLRRPARARGCRRAAWMKASLRRIDASRYRWRLSLGRKAAPGSYLLRVLAEDAGGNRTGGALSTKGVRLRVSKR
jgi:glucose/arabinose dehydrogenase/PKD repeat protein